MNGTLAPADRATRQLARDYQEALREWECQKRLDQEFGTPESVDTVACYRDLSSARSEFYDAARALHLTVGQTEGYLQDARRWLGLPAEGD